MQVGYESYQRWQKRLEAYLYYSATSREMYLNVLTLKTRLRNAALDMSASLLSVCIDEKHEEEECSICQDNFWENDTSV